MVSKRKNETDEEFKIRRKAYNATPTVKAARGAHASTPEARAAKKAREATPEYKAVQKAYEAAPERIAAKKNRGATPEVKAAKKAYAATPEAKAVRKARSAAPEAKAAQKAYNASPEGKAVRKAYNSSPEAMALKAVYLQAHPEQCVGRFDAEYMEWMLAVKGRDNWTCVGCGTRGETFHAHHILSWAEYPQFRHTVANGITLCKTCHNATLKHEEEFEEKFFNLLFN